MADSIFTDTDLKNVLNMYTQEAVGNQELVKRRVMNRLPRKKKSPGQVCFRRAITAAAVLVLAFAFFAYTPAGNTAAEAIVEGVEKVIEWLFPPKEVTVTLEGMEEEITHDARVVEYDEDGLSDFVIYVDESSYYTSEENGVFTIRPVHFNVNDHYTRAEIADDLGSMLDGLSEQEMEQKIDERLAELQDFYDGLPECKIEITQAAGASPLEVAEETLGALREAYPYVSEIEDTKLIDGLWLNAESGNEWDSEIVEVYFVDNQTGGTFIITARYFLEAVEGHGGRFATMISTFEVLMETKGAD